MIRRAAELVAALVNDRDAMIDRASEKSIRNSMSVARLPFDFHAAVLAVSASLPHPAVAYNLAFLQQSEPRVFEPEVTVAWTIHCLSLQSKRARRNYG